MDWYVMQLTSESPQWLDATEEFPLVLTNATLLSCSQNNTKRVVVSMSPAKENMSQISKIPLCVLLPGKQESVCFQHLITAPNKVFIEGEGSIAVEVSGVALVGRICR
eukprot:jgi/Galph1/5083/GphlegSOOS_G3722.1